MSLKTARLTTLGAAAAAVVEKLRAMPVPPGVETFDATNRENWLKMRERDVTASAIGALLGIHDFVTPYGYWANKSGAAVEEVEENEAMERGSDLEPIVIKRVRKRHPDWSVISPGLYYRDANARIGATPDALVFCPKRGLGNLQIKTTVDSVFRDKWFGEDGLLAPPLWIAAQTIIEAHLVGAQWAAVAVMVLSGYGAGLKVEIIEIPLSAKLVKRIYEAAADFWRRVEENDPPAPDYGRDAKTIAAVYADDNGDEIDLSDNPRVAVVIAERERLKGIEAAGSAAEKERKALDAELIHILGNNSRGTLADGRIVVAKTVSRDGFTTYPTQYRSIKIKDVSNGRSSRGRRGDRSQPATTEDHFRDPF